MRRFKPWIGRIDYCKDYPLCDCGRCPRCGSCAAECGGPVPEYIIEKYGGCEREFECENCDYHWIKPAPRRKRKSKHK